MNAMPPGSVERLGAATSLTSTLWVLCDGWLKEKPWLFCAYTTLVLLAVLNLGAWLRFRKSISYIYSPAVVCPGTPVPTPS